jgi:hypothetical protein
MVLSQITLDLVVWNYTHVLSQFLWVTCPCLGEQGPLLRSLQGISQHCDLI